MGRAERLTAPLGSLRRAYARVPSDVRAAAPAAALVAVVVLAGTTLGVAGSCFMVLAEDAGAAHLWRLDATPLVDLPATDGDGRVWDPAAWLWRAPGERPGLPAADLLVLGRVLDRMIGEEHAGLASPYRYLDVDPGEQVDPAETYNLTVDGSIGLDAAETEVVRRVLRG